MGRYTTQWVFALVVIFSINMLPAKARRLPQRRWLDTEGLYYLDAGPDSELEQAFVITRDGKVIPPKDNDPDAPTLPGLYVAGTRFRFTSYRVTSGAVSFRTVSVRGVAYWFVGRVGREDVESIKSVPYVVGTLLRTKRGKTNSRKARFVHAVIL